MESARLEGTQKEREDASGRLCHHKKGGGGGAMKKSANGGGGEESRRAGSGENSLEFRGNRKKREKGRTRLLCMGAGV